MSSHLPGDFETATSDRSDRNESRSHHGTESYPNRRRSVARGFDATTIGGSMQRKSSNEQWHTDLGCGPSALVSTLVSTDSSSGLCAGVGSWTWSETATATVTSGTSAKSDSDDFSIEVLPNSTQRKKSADRRDQPIDGDQRPPGSWKST